MHGNKNFFDLADHCFFTGKKEVSCNLLGNSTGALAFLAGSEPHTRRSADPYRINTFMFIKTNIFGG